MKLDKKTFKMILSLAVLVILFAWLISNAGMVLGFIKRVMTILSPLFMGLVVAFLMNIVLRPLEKLWKKLEPKKRGKALHAKLMRPVCIVLSLLVIFGVVFAVIFIVVPEISKTVMSFVDKLPEYAEKIEKQWNEISDTLAKYAVAFPEIDLDADEIVRKVTNFATKHGPGFLSSTIGFTTNIVSSVAQFFISIVFAVYILAQKEHFGIWSKKFLAAMFRPRRANSIFSFCSLVNRSFTSFVTGQCTEAVILGSLCFLGMVILKMPFAPVISVLVGFMSLIPIFGAWIATIVGVLLIALDSPMLAVWFVVFILVLQQFEGNLIYPKVVGKSVGLPALFVLLAVTIGGSAFGILGMLVAVPTMSVIYTVVKAGIENRLQAKGITDEIY